jgi:hypothetical protein
MVDSASCHIFLSHTYLSLFGSESETKILISSNQKVFKTSKTKSTVLLISSFIWSGLQMIWASS